MDRRAPCSLKRWLARSQATRVVNVYSVQQSTGASSATAWLCVILLLPSVLISNYAAGRDRKLAARLDQHCYTCSDETISAPLLGSSRHDERHIPLQHSDSTLLSIPSQPPIPPPNAQNCCTTIHGSASLEETRDTNSSERRGAGDNHALATSRGSRSIVRLDALRQLVRAGGDGSERG